MRQVFKRRSLALFSMIAAVTMVSGLAQATHPPGTGNNAISGSTFCDGSGSPIVGEGSASQLRVHSEVFGPAYAKECSTGNASVNVQATGDEYAYNRLADRSRPFGVADAPLSTVQKVLLEKDYPQLGMRMSEVQQIPLYIDAVAVGYNLPCSVPSGSTLKLRSPVISQIFSGTITTWNHPTLTVDNSFLASCPGTILPVKRTGFAGPTYNFKDYLSKRNPEWNYYKQPERNQTWPDRAGFTCVAEDDAGMARCINTNPGAIGYVQYAAAVTAGTKVAAVENSSLQLVTPSAQNCSVAAANVITTADVENLDLFNQLPFGTGGDWSTVSLTDSRVGYPICNFGYAYAFGYWYGANGHMGQSSLRTLVDYLLTSVGISYNPAHHHLLLNKGFTPLPPSVARVALQGIEGMHMF